MYNEACPRTCTCIIFVVSISYHDGLLDLVSIAGINYVFCMVYSMQQVEAMAH